MPKARITITYTDRKGTLVKEEIRDFTDQDDMVAYFDHAVDSLSEPEDNQEKTFYGHPTPAWGLTCLILRSGDQGSVLVTAYPIKGAD